MRAIRVHSLTGPDGIRVEDVPQPELADGSVLIDVHAAGVSFPDLLLTKGMYQFKPDPPFVLGSELAGTVRAAGEGSEFSVGQRVAALTFGAYADVASAPEMMTFPLPDELSFEEGAGLIINYHTVLFALRDRGRLQSGETLLVHGAAGGVGTAAIQVAKAMGARVFGVVSSEEKAQTAREAGADEVFLTNDDWRNAAKAATGGSGVEMVLDPVGGERFTDSLRSLTDGGRVLVVGFAEGTIPEVRVNRLLLRNLDIVGVAWGSYVGTRPELARAIGDGVNELVVSGAIRPLVSESYAFDEAAAALRSLDDRTARGKVVLRVRDE